MRTREREAQATIDGLTAELIQYDKDRDEYWKVVARLNLEITELKAERDKLAAKVQDFERLAVDGDERDRIRSQARQEERAQVVTDLRAILDQYKNYPESTVDRITW